MSELRRSITETTTINTTPIQYRNEGDQSIICWSISELCWSNAGGLSQSFRTSDRLDNAAHLILTGFAENGNGRLFDDWLIERQCRADRWQPSALASVHHRLLAVGCRYWPDVAFERPTDDVTRRRDEVFTIAQRILHRVVYKWWSFDNVKYWTTKLEKHVTELCSLYLQKIL